MSADQLAYLAIGIPIGWLLHMAFGYAWDALVTPLFQRSFLKAVEADRQRTEREWNARLEANPPPKEPLLWRTRVPIKPEQSEHID